MTHNKSYIFTYVFLVLLLFTIGALDVIEDFIENNIFKLFVFLFISFYFIAVVFIWIISVRRRVLNDAFKRQYTAVAVYLILILSSMMIKYRFIWDDTVERYIWYFWYPLMILVPLNSFYACLYLGREEEYHISRKWYVLYIPAVILSLFVMTNDIHQLTFRFNEGFLNYSSDYERRIIYYIIVAWISILFLAVLVLTLIRCGYSKSKKLIYIPILVLIIGGIGFLLIVLADMFHWHTVFSFPSFFSIFVVIFLESLIQINLVRTNVGYFSFYQRSGILSLVTDENLNTIYTTNLDFEASKQELQSIIDGYADFNQNRKYHFTKLKYGYFFFGSDITEINSLQEQLLDIGLSLDDENEIIKAENELAKKRVSIEK